MHVVSKSQLLGAMTLDNPYHQFVMVLIQIIYKVWEFELCRKYLHVNSIAIHTKEA